MRERGRVRVCGALAACCGLGVLVSGCATLHWLTAPRVRACGDGRLQPVETFPQGYRLHARYRVQSPRVELGFELLAERRDAELVLLGLGPLGAKAFVVRQRGSEAEVERFPGPASQFAPINALRDLHAAVLGGADPESIQREGCPYRARLVPLERPAAWAAPRPAREG